MNKINITYLAFTLSNIRAIARAAPGAPDPTEQDRQAAMGDCLKIFESLGREISLRLDEPNWESIDDEPFFDYLNRVFEQIREHAANREADLQMESGEDDPYDGYVGNLLSVLTLMQINADSLGLDRRRLGMDGFDPIKSDLTPYRSRTHVRE